MHQRPERVPKRLVDAGVVAAVALVGLFGLIGPVVLIDASPQRVSATGVILVVVHAAALWWRRTYPIAALSVTLAALLVAQGLGDLNAPSFLGVQAGAYAAGAYTARRPAFMALALLAVAGAADAAVAQLADVSGPYAAVAFTPFGALAVLAWIAGRYMAVRRAYLDTLVAYGHQLERDRDEQARQAVREERRRIARDLHDQVAHHLGVVSLQTSAARRWIRRDPIRTETALRAAEDASRAALETMPAILQALRAEDAPDGLEPRPTLDGVEDLLRRVGSDDVAVDLRVHGQRRPLPSAVELTAYRLIQESLTNVVRHAGPARAVVDLHYRPRRLDIAVTDDGRGAAAATSNGSRLGLIGMRERVEMLGGTFSAGPQKGGGFSVRAILPVPGGPA